MWFALLKWLFVNVLLPALVGSAGTLFALRSMEDSEPVTTFAASEGGGNFLLWVIVIGLVVHAFFTSKIPQLETFKSWILGKLAEWLKSASDRISEGVSK